MHKHTNSSSNNEQHSGSGLEQAHVVQSSVDGKCPQCGKSTGIGIWKSETAQLLTLMPHEICKATYTDQGRRFCEQDWMQLGNINDPAYQLKSLDHKKQAQKRVTEALDILTKENRNYCPGCGNPVYMCYCHDND